MNYLEYLFISERKAGATCSPKVRETVAGSFDPGEKLMRGVGTTVLMAARVMLMLHHRHAGMGGLADVQWGAVPAEYFYGRPVRQHGNARRSVRSEFLSG